MPFRRHSAHPLDAVFSNPFVYVGGCLTLIYGGNRSTHIDILAVIHFPRTSVSALYNWKGQKPGRGHRAPKMKIVGGNFCLPPLHMTEMVVYFRARNLPYLVSTNFGRNDSGRGVRL